MRNRINDWLSEEAVPRDLHARVMGDPRLAGGGALRTRLAFATTALVVLLVAGGLGSILLRGSHPGGAAGVVPGSPAASATPSTTATADVPSPSPSSSAASTPLVMPCRTADLDISLGSAGGAAGSIYVPVNLRNHTASACTMKGYFGAALLSSAGAQVGPDPARDPDPSGATPGLVSLAPGASTSFTFHWSDVQNSPQPCPVAAEVEFTAPDQFDHVFVPARTSEGMAIAPCSPGSTGLTPVGTKP